MVKEDKSDVKKDGNSEISEIIHEHFQF